MGFTQEELAVIAPFHTSSRITLLGELGQSLPDIYQPDLKQAMRSAIGKLDAMSDGEFDLLDCFDAGEYGWEDVR